ncbi:MAG: hypothetical protein WBV36_04460, partial [Terriglobales bacterium]
IDELRIGERKIGELKIGELKIGESGQGQMIHVEIFHQPPHCRHGDFHRHGVGWFAHGSKLAGRAVPEHHSA